MRRRTVPIDVVQAAIPRESSLTRQHIFAALAVREPQTIEQLSTQIPVTTLQSVAPRMVAQGVIVRARFGGRRYWYARTNQALRQAPLVPQAVANQTGRTYHKWGPSNMHMHDLSAKEIDRRYTIALRRIRAERRGAGPP